ncbi:hypothetical protein TWF718_004883 [Orbilia javanica]|uniref:Uncharacterized protein n=1 Tax=Orbilia javanica TaxID=47235 RepID=A0AAN8N6Y3_9PEZI
MSDSASSSVPTADPTLPEETVPSTTGPSETSTPPPEETTTTTEDQPTTTPTPEPTSEPPTSTTPPPPPETTTTSEPEPETTSTTEEPTSTTEEPSSTPEPETTSTTDEPTSTPEPESTSTPSLTVITVTPTSSADTTITITTTSVNTDRTTSSLPSSSTQLSSSSSSSTATATSLPSSGGGGLSQPAKIAIAIIIPIFGVILFAFLALFLWRRHKKRKDNAEERRKEVEEYGYNPNNDTSGPGPSTLAAAGGASHGGDMAEMEAGYRGWGNTAGGRKASAPLSASAATSNTAGVGGYGSTNYSGVPTSGVQQYVPPPQPQQSELYGSPPMAAGAIPVAAGVTGVAGVAGAAALSAHSDDEAKNRDRHSHSPLLSSPTNRPSTADSSTIGAPPTTTGPSELDDGLHRGDSVASSRYTNATQQSEDSGAHDVSGNNRRNTYVSEGNDYYNDVSNPYGGDFDYPDHSPEQGYHQPPMIQQVGARRNTRIENPPDTHYAQMPRQGNSGIAQNF